VTEAAAGGQVGAKAQFSGIGVEYPEARSTRRLDSQPHCPFPLLNAATRRLITVQIRQMTPCSSFRHGVPATAPTPPPHQPRHRRHPRSVVDRQHRPCCCRGRDRPSNRTPPTRTRHRADRTRPGSVRLRPTAHYPTRPESEHRMTTTTTKPTTITDTLQGWLQRQPERWSGRRDSTSMADLDAAWTAAWDLPRR